jgi:hypothetical protein
MIDKSESSREAQALLAGVTPSEVDARIDDASIELYGVTLVKRIAAEIGGIRGSLISTDDIGGLAVIAQDDRFADHVLESIERRARSSIDADEVRRVVERQRELIDREWPEARLRRSAAPGSEILDGVFGRYQLRYRKPKDTIALAAALNPNEVADEIREILDRAAQLVSTSTR